MADNEATFRFILQDEGGGTAPGGGASAAPAAGASEAAIKKTKVETASTAAGTAVRAASDTKLAAKVSGLVSTGQAGAGVGRAAAAGNIAGAAGGISALSAAGPAGIAIAAIAAGAIGSVVAVNKLRSASLQRAAQIGGLSPDIARAQAQAEVRELQQRLRSARRLGPTFARQIEAESRLSTATQSASEAVLTPLLEDLAKATSDIATIAEAADKWSNSEIGQTIIEAGWDALKKLSGLAKIEAALEATAALLKGEQEQELGSFFGMFAADGHLMPADDEWPGGKPSGETVVGRKFRAPPGAAAGGDFLRIGAGVL